MANIWCKLYPIIRWLQNPRRSNSVKKIFIRKKL